MFKKGVSGNPAGRKPGTRTTRVRLMRELAEMIVTHPGVQTKLLEKAFARERVVRPTFGRLSARDLLQRRFHCGPQDVVQPNEGGDFPLSGGFSPERHITRRDNESG
jgi:hypothetical protein